MSPPGTTPARNDASASSPSRPHRETSEQCRFWIVRPRPAFSAADARQYSLSKRGNTICRVSVLRHLHAQRARLRDRLHEKSRRNISRDPHLPRLQHHILLRAPVRILLLRRIQSEKRPVFRLRPYLQKFFDEPIPRGPIQVPPALQFFPAQFTLVSIVQQPSYPLQIRRRQFRRHNPHPLTTVC